MVENSIKVVIDKIFELKENESFLLITDTLKEEMARPFFEYAETISNNSKIIVMEPLSRNGEEPKVEVSKTMLENDVILMLTSKSLSHTKARRDASENKARIISSPGLTQEMLDRCVDIDYDDLIAFHDKLRPIIVNSKEIKVTSKKGTDITLSVENTHGKSSELLKNKIGNFGNLPTGEVDSGVLNAQGRLIIDGSMAGVGILNEDLVLDVKNNYATVISETDESKQLKDLLDSVGPDAYKIAELGIGTNPNAIITGKVLEDEKVKGTVHFAVGNDLSYGGKNNVPIHLDGVIKEPTLIVDGKIIMKDGKYLI